jgi:hypothetical protein
VASIYSPQAKPLGALAAISPTISLLTAYNITIGMDTQASHRSCGDSDPGSEDTPLAGFQYFTILGSGVRFERFSPPHCFLRGAVKFYKANTLSD